jgi:hypothetical protein
MTYTKDTVAATRVILVLLCLNAVLGNLHAEDDIAIKAKLVRVDKIWSEAPHSAFTDLIRWNDRWYCAFREAQKHVGTQGQLRIINYY